LRMNAVEGVVEVVLREHVLDGPSVGNCVAGRHGFKF